MICYNCGQEVADGSQNCMHCGAVLGAGETVVLDQQYNPYAQQNVEQAPVYQPAAPVYQPAAPAQPAAAPAGGRPVIQLPTGRGLAKMIFLSLITLGIYGVVVMCKIVTELNIVASRYDGKRTMPYFAVAALTPLTLGILPLVWTHNMCDRIGFELRRRNIDYKFSAGTFWLWSFLGSFIVIGPFVYVHKFMKAMNLLNGHFNVNG